MPLTADSSKSKCTVPLTADSSKSNYGMRSIYTYDISQN